MLNLDSCSPSSVNTWTHELPRSTTITMSSLSAAISVVTKESVPSLSVPAATCVVLTSLQSTPPLFKYFIQEFDSFFEKADAS